MIIKKGKNKYLMQLENRSTLLKLLHNNKNVCRKDLSEISGLTGATVTNIIKDLIDINLVTENRDYNGSRTGNAISLRINYESFYVIGMAFKRGRISYGVSDLSGNFLEKHNIHIKLDESVNNVLNTLSSAVKTCVEKYNSKGKIVGLGLAVPGPINLNKGEISYLTHLPGWETVPIKQHFESKFKFPIIMDEVANATAFAEAWFGGAQNYQNIISLLVSKGVGAGIIINGKIYHGDYGLAGEVGHTSINYNGPLCECGSRGCLELYCSTLTLLKKSQKICGTKQLNSINDLRKLLNNGNEQIRNIIIENGRYLGYGIVNLINSFNPELIVLHSKMNEFGDVWLDSIKSVAKERLRADNNLNIKIKYSTLNDDSILLGAGAMVCDFVFNTPYFKYFQ